MFIFLFFRRFLYCFTVLLLYFFNFFSVFHFLLEKIEKEEKVEKVEKVEEVEKVERAEIWRYSSTSFTFFTFSTFSTFFYFFYFFYLFYLFYYFYLFYLLQGPLSGPSHGLYTFSSIMRNENHIFKWFSLLMIFKNSYKPYRKPIEINQADSYMVCMNF